jgi:peptide-methionine (R)-S-oxide reductase
MAMASRPQSPALKANPMRKASASTHPGKISETDAEWRTQLTTEQFYVTRQHGTERAGTSPLNNGAALSVKLGDP